MPDRRAIVFDLDDTLYPYRAFVSSGLRAVAVRVAREHGISGVDALRVLRRAAVSRRGQEVQSLCERFGLSPASIGPLVGVIREHTPSIRLPRESARVLAALRPRWTLGVLTNGEPRIQRRKVAALGLAGLVDAVVCATECGNGTGKPEPAAFEAVLERLNVGADRSVFVGDDVRADMEGATAAGMKTIHVTAPSGFGARCAARACSVHAPRLSLVPALAERLVPAGMESHAA